MHEYNESQHAMRHAAMRQNPPWRGQPPQTHCRCGQQALSHTTDPAHSLTHNFTFIIQSLHTHARWYTYALTDFLYTSAMNSGMHLHCGKGSQGNVTNVANLRPTVVTGPVPDHCMPHTHADRHILMTHCQQSWVASS